MKHLYKFIEKNIDIVDILAVVFFSIFAWYWIDDTNGIIVKILGGIPNESGNTIETVLLGKWLFLFSFYFFLVCRKLVNMRKLLTFSLHRYKTFKMWWEYYFITILKVNFIFFISTCSIWASLEIVEGKWNNENFNIILVFFLHLSFLISILVLSDIIFEEKMAPCILLVLEGILYIYSVNYNLPFLACGMYVRASDAEIGIFSMVAYGFEILTIVVCLFLPPKLWKYGYLERKMIGWKA